MPPIRWMAKKPGERPGKASYLLGDSDLRFRFEKGLTGWLLDGL